MAKKHTDYLGHIALLGQTNVGKSSLLNALASVRVSATAPMPNTTRGSVYKKICENNENNENNTEVVCIDTPGGWPIHGDLQSKLMRKQIKQLLSFADGRIFVTDARRFGENDRRLLRRLTEEKKETPLILVLNKADLLANRSEVFPLIVQWDEQLKKIGLKAKEIISVSALTGHRIPVLRKALFAMLPASPVTDAVPNTCNAFIAGELLREQLFRKLRQEVPFGLCVLCEHLQDNRDKPNMLFVDLSVLAEKESHKPIILGKNGARMKTMASAARKSMEIFFGKKVMLRVRVHTQKDWKSSASVLSKTLLGLYDENSENIDEALPIEPPPTT